VERYRKHRSSYAFWMREDVQLAYSMGEKKDVLVSRGGQKRGGSSKRDTERISVVPMVTEKQ